jgi:DNA-binding transcriptional ArsR family regulator
VDNGHDRATQRKRRQAGDCDAFEARKEFVPSRRQRWHAPERQDGRQPSDPRFQIVQRLAAEGDRACGTFGIAVGKTNMSYHIKVLREAGIIRQRGEGTQRINCLRREDLDARFPGLLETLLRAGVVGNGPHAEPETVTVGPLSL